MDERIRNNAYRFDKDMYISPEGTIGEYFNHSCDPNVYIQKIKRTLSISALKEIRSSDEITFDYSTVIANDDIWKMKCNCGSKNCRKIIKSFSSLPTNIKKEYIKQKIVPAYILKI